VPTYYDVLGVQADAAPDELRRAYLALARALHPDRTIAAPKHEADQASRRMQQVNEAWRVLRDPASRAAYDRALADAGRRRPDARASRPPAHDLEDDADLDIPFAHTPARPGDVGVSIARALPWVAVAVILVAIFVFTAFAGPKHRAPRLSGYVGACISVGPVSAVAPVPCEGPNDGKVVRVASSSSDCPSGSTGRQVGTSWLCLAPVQPVP
jgi:curved DNA-binding protein CbpA